MDVRTILIETVVLAILFTIGVVADSKNPVDTVYDMPEPIINRCLELGLIDESKKADSPQTRRKRLFAAVVIALIMALALCFVNHAGNFLQGFLISYLIWLIVDWYDCFVIDWIWVCHSKKLVIPGTEDLTDSIYRQLKRNGDWASGVSACRCYGTACELVHIGTGERYNERNQSNKFIGK